MNLPILATTYLKTRFYALQKRSIPSMLFLQSFHSGSDMNPVLMGLKKEKESQTFC